MWKPINGTPDFECDGFIAYYQHTDWRSGQGLYWVFPASTPKSKRKMKNAVCVGGLPATQVLDRYRCLAH